MNVFEAKHKCPPRVIQQREHSSGVCYVGSAVCRECEYFGGVYQEEPLWIKCNYKPKPYRIEDGKPVPWWRLLWIKLTHKRGVPD